MQKREMVLTASFRSLVMYKISCLLVVVVFTCYLEATYYKYDTDAPVEEYNPHYSVVKPHCHAGWKEYGNHCYFFGGLKVTWQAAQDICRGRGGNLVKIESAAENRWLQSQLHERRYMWWIGLNDKACEGDWRWVSDNSKATYTDWLRAEPNGGRGENCVHLYVHSKWNDRPCSHRILYICEKNKY